MTKIRRMQTQRGFTLVELMITVALIGLLATMAIPNFLDYQAKTRRSEAKTTLAGIAKAYTGFYSEKGFYPDMRTETDAMGLGVKPALPDIDITLLGSQKNDWSTAEPFFDIVGYQSDGMVWHIYDITAPTPFDNKCTGGCADCFTITAHGDTNTNGFPGAVMFSHPERDNNGNVINECSSALLGYTAPVDPNGGPVYDEPAVNLGAGDQY